MKTILFILLTSLTLSAKAQGIEAVLQQIEANNTTLAALRQQAEAEKLGNRTTANFSDPEVEMGYLWGSPSSIGHRKDFSASQSVDMATLSGARRQLVRQQNLLVDEQMDAARLSILLEARQLYVDAIYYNRLCQHFTLRHEQAKMVADMQLRRLKEGDNTRIDYQQALLDQHMTSGQLQRCLTERQVTMEGLKRLNGNRDLIVGDTLFPTIVLPNDDATLMREMTARHPSLRALKQQLTVTRQQLTVNRREGLPQVSLGFMGEYVEGEKYQGVKLGMSIPLWSNCNKVRQAKAKVAADEARLTDGFEQRLNAVQTLFKRQQGLRLTADTYREAMEKSSNGPLLQKAMEAGQLSVIDYLNGLRLTDAAIEAWLDAEREWQRTCAELLIYN